MKGKGKLLPVVLCGLLSVSMAACGQAAGTSGGATAGGDRASVASSSVSSIYGTADTEGFTTLKAFLDEGQAQPGGEVAYTGSVKVSLTQDGQAVSADKIDLSNAYVSLDDGDGYVTDDFVFSGAHNDIKLEDGLITYALNTGDITWNNYDYPVGEGGLEWSCIGGDGAGKYVFNMSLHGVSYDGKEVDAIPFEVTVYIYGREFSATASPQNPSGSRWGAGGYDSVELIDGTEDLSAAPANDTDAPVFTWASDTGAGIPVLCDYSTSKDGQLTFDASDDFYVSWPKGVDASGLKPEDVTITLTSEYGDELVLRPTTGTTAIQEYTEEGGAQIPNGDYRVYTSEVATQIDLTYVYWPMAPVYSKMKVSVDATNVKGVDESVETTYDIASVYTHQVQMGGGLDIVDTTVTVNGLFGLDGIGSMKIGNVYEDLSSDIKYYYAVTDPNSHGPHADALYVLGENDQVISANDLEEGAKLEDKAAYFTADTNKNVQLLGHNVFATDDSVPAGLEAQKKVTYNGEELTFTLTAAGRAGGLKVPEGAETLPGYILSANGNYDDHQRWGWLYFNNVDKDVAWYEGETVSTTLDADFSGLVPAK
ncbi:hypothetical protein [Paratractidigestivibacter sp.]|uniref:hypothetical protein n=1 Tax=Paratractidigestivibacter sp. TaxID=2847316 RepID=UPI002ABDB380|nr:hypothetical protein [Paratractidigestivibacter sp.]